MCVCGCFTQEAIEKKEKRARRFHFRAEDNVAQRDMVLDRELMKKGERSIKHLVQVCDGTQFPLFNLVLFQHRCQ